MLAFNHCVFSKVRVARTIGDNEAEVGRGQVTWNFLGHEENNEFHLQWMEASVGRLELSRGCGHQHIWLLST